jgi:D-amino-acid oxidase
MLAPVEVSWDRIIRTTVGLRPHRPSGFVLSVEKLDAKTIIHNYGHGGAGMSLTWGTGHLAAEFAIEHQDRRAAVLGCGVAGLTTARQLQRRGFAVTIYAMATPPDTTSNMSLAGFTPLSGLVEAGRRTPEWDAQFRRAAEIAYRQLQLLAGGPYGVTWIDHYSPTDELHRSRPDQRWSDLQAGLQPGHVILGPGEHPFPSRYAIRQPGLRIEPSIYLDALSRDFLLFGGRIVIRKFETPNDLMSIGESLVVNCTGLGARALFRDEELTPHKGQLVALVPQPEVNYATNGGVRNTPSQPGIGIHMMPRADGIILGGTSESGVWTLEPNEAERTRVVRGHMELFGGMRQRW